MSLLIPVVLSLLVLAAATLLLLLLRARNRRLLMTAPGVRSALQEGPGISLLACGIDREERIARLLCVEYARYEVVATIDGRRHPELFARLLDRYRMIGMEWLPDERAHERGMRGVYRSRNRCFRRLVLIDSTAPCETECFDIAASVASYELLLPLPGDRMLLPGAVERLAAEYTALPGEEPEWIGSAVGTPVEMIARERVLDAGGFGRRPARTVPRARRRRLWEPLARRCRPQRRGGGLRRPLRWAAALLLAAAALVSALAGQWPLTAVVLTVAALWASFRCAVLLISEEPR